MALLAVLPKREFDYRNILKALPVVHKYNLSTLLNEMVEWLTRPSYDDSEDGVEHDVADDTEEDEYENEDEEDYNTYYKAELSSFLGVDEKDPGSYVLTWLLVTEKLQLECLHRICDIQSRATVEKWLQLPESDLAIIRPCLVDALMIMRGSDRMFICTEDDSWEVDVVHWAELGHAFNIRDVEDLCLGWLEENMEVVLTGVEEDEAEVMKPTSITRWLRLVEEPTFASLKPICTEWLASNIKTCLTEQNVYSWIKRSQDNKWESVLSAIFTWLADSCKCEGFQVRPSTSTPYTSVVDSLEVPCALSSPVLVQLLQTSSGRWSPGLFMGIPKYREDCVDASIKPSTKFRLSQQWIDLKANFRQQMKRRKPFYRYASHQPHPNPKKTKQSPDALISQEPSKRAFAPSSVPMGSSCSSSRSAGNGVVPSVNSSQGDGVVSRVNSSQWDGVVPRVNLPQVEGVVPGTQKARDYVKVVAHFVKRLTLKAGVNLMEALLMVEQCAADEIPWNSPMGEVEELRAVLVRFTGLRGIGDVAEKPFHGPSDYFVSHAWSYKLADLVGLVRNHYEGLTGSRSKYFPVFYWVDIFAVNENFSGNFADHPDGDFERVIKECKRGVVFTMHPWNAPITPQRIWCLYEAFAAVKLGANLELLLDPQFKSQRLTGKAIQSNFITNVVDKLDVGKAQATVESDRSRIIKLNSTAGKELIKEGATLNTPALKFKFTGITDRSVEIISMAIRGSSTLVSLDLSPLGVTGPITDDGVKLLAQALKSNSSLTELTLSGNPGIGCEGVAAISDVLLKREDEAAQQPSQLSILRLSNVGMEASGCKHISGLVSGDFRLEVLDISQNRGLKPFDICGFLKAMEGNVHLKDLCLKKLDMGKKSVYMALASMLKDNSSLTSLNVACCQLDSGASEVLSPGLFNHPSLKHLNVSGNSLLNSNQSLHLVAPALAQNPVLHTLLLRDCDIPLSGLSTLQKGIQRNKVLKKVDMTSTGAALADSWMQLGVVDPRVELDVTTMWLAHSGVPPSLKLLSVAM
eukprot:gene11199-18816_t